jgi:repressor LexA
MTFGERVNKKRKERGITQEELAQRLGYKSRSSIAKIENGDRDVPRPMIIELAKALDTTPAYLMGWEDNAPDKLEPNATLLSKEHIHLIPVFESVAAGFGAYADNRIVEYMPLYIVSESEAENTIVVKVQGDSMYPKIENGDSIQVLRQDFADNGQVVVIMIDEENAVVKKYEYDKKNKTVKLHSFNPEYKDREFKGIEIEQLRILGVVKKVIKDI